MGSIPGSGRSPGGGHSNPLQYSCWKRVKAGGEGHDRGWDGCMASPTRWTWVWASSVSWWWTGKPDVLQSLGSHRVGHDWTTELNWTGISAGKESTCNAGDSSSIPGSRRSPGEGISYPFQYSWASLVAQMVKSPPTMWETWVRSLGWKDPLEKGTATHSSILA